MFSKLVFHYRIESHRSTIEFDRTPEEEGSIALKNRMFIAKFRALLGRKGNTSSKLQSGSGILEQEA